MSGVDSSLPAPRPVVPRGFPGRSLHPDHASSKATAPRAAETRERLPAARSGPRATPAAAAGSRRPPVVDEPLGALNHRGGAVEVGYTPSPMKRDPELYRQILSEVESWSTTVEPKEVRIEGYSQDQIG